MRRTSSTANLAFSSRVLRNSGGHLKLKDSVSACRVTILNSRSTNVLFSANDDCIIARTTPPPV